MAARAALQQARLNSQGKKDANDHSAALGLLQRRLLALLSGIEGTVNPEGERDPREPVPLTAGIGLTRLDN